MRDYSLESEKLPLDKIKLKFEKNLNLLPYFPVECSVTLNQIAFEQIERFGVYRISISKYTLPGIFSFFL